MLGFYHNRRFGLLRSFLLFLPFLFLGGIIAAGCGDRVLPPDDGNGTPKNYRIAYNTAAGNDFDAVATIGDKGEDRRELPDLGPIFAPPGQGYMVMGGREFLQIIDLEDGSTVRQIPRRYGKSINYFSTAISPDGSKIAYSVDYGDAQTTNGSTRRVVIVGADGGNPVMLNVGAGHESYIRFSPDGNSIAFFDATTERNGWLYVARTDGTDVRRIADVAQVAHDGAMHFSWSPDGKQIAYMDFEDFMLKVAATDGSGVRTLGQGGYPDWSPDGKKIAFVSQELASLALINSDGSGEPESLNRIAITPQWSPDGKKLLYFTIVPELDIDQQVPVMTVMNMETRQSTVLGDGFIGYWIR